MSGAVVLNPALDYASLGAEYRRRGRVRVPAALEAGVAERLAHCLRDEVPWGLATFEDGPGRARRAEELAAMSPAELQAIIDRVHATARDGYEFLYNTYMMVTAFKERRDPQLFLHRFLQFMNSPGMIGFARSVTGDPEIMKADAQATRYLPGHFLRRHNDVHQASERDTRRAAYVFNLTRNWQADWGGLLHFLDDAGRVEETWAPGYNVLAIFRVPTWHCVSCVAPFATEPRLAITGWLRSH